MPLLIDCDRPRHSVMGGDFEELRNVNYSIKLVPTIEGKEQYLSVSEA